MRAGRAERQCGLSKRHPWSAPFRSPRPRLPWAAPAACEPPYGQALSSTGPRAGGGSNDWLLLPLPAVGEVSAITARLQVLTPPHPPQVSPAGGRGRQDDEGVPHGAQEGGQKAGNQQVCKGGCIATWRSRRCCAGASARRLDWFCWVSGPKLMQMVCTFNNCVAWHGQAAAAW